MKTDMSDPTFGIGAVARLTGIPMDTLRIWERRYSAVVPRRSSQNRRFYSRDDVTRLLLIKQLVEQGEPVSTVVHLREVQLRERLHAHLELQQTGFKQTPVAGVLDQGLPSVLVFGEVLPYQMRHWSIQLASIDFVGGHNVFSEFEREALNSRPDILIMEFPALQAEAVGRIRELLQQSEFQKVIVVYAFATRPLLERIRKLGITAVRAPVTPSILLEACQVLHIADRPESVDGDHITAISPRRFSGKQLGMIAGIESRLVCECPHHLVDLVSRVSAFERYSLDCELQTPKDAVVHERLHCMTAHARDILESALAYLLESEGIDIPDHEDSEPG